jgi:hypothetical protein
MPNYKLCELRTFQASYITAVFVQVTTLEVKTFKTTHFFLNLVCVCVCVYPKINIILQTVPNTTRLITVTGETFLV